MLTMHLVSSRANADATADVLVSGSTLIISGSIFADGEGFPATTPNSSAAHRNAILVENSGTLVLANGATVQVANNDNNTAFLRVGYDDVPGGDGTLNINSGAVLQIGQSSRYANFHIGEGSGVTGLVNQSGGSVTVLGSLNIGVDGGTGVYTINGGLLTIDNADDAGHTSLATIGLNLNAAGGGTSNGLLLINGGTVSVLAHELGSSGTFGSVALILGNRDRGVDSYGDGNGAITQNGGVLYVSNLAGLYLSSVGSGTYNLNGGELQIGANSLKAKYGNGPGTYAFNLGSGTISVTGTDLNTSVNANLVGSATTYFNTNGLNMNWTGNLTGSGSHQIDYGGNALRKIGSGTLTISGSNVLDTFGALQDTTRQTAGRTSAVEFMVGSGSGSSAQFILSGGTLAITPSTLADGTTPVAGSFRVGDFSGSGTFNQTGGTLILQDNSAFNIGNQGGSGVFNLSGGQVILNDGLHVVGRSAAGKSASSGVINVSSGTFSVQNGGQLILGNNLKADASSATFNQTGGVVSFDNDSTFFLSGLFNTGSSVYNLLGGELRIGGNSFQPRYNNGSSPYQFNFGSGTISVTDSSLNSAVNARLVGDAASVINTNGLNANWSGNFIGSGSYQVGVGGNGLYKIGSGTLTISGSNNVFDTFATLQDATRQTTGQSSAVEFMVGSGSGSSAQFILSGGTLTINPSFSGTTPVAGSFRVGDFSGSGTFNQSGGALVIANNSGFNIGNQGGSGVYNLLGGELDLNDSLNVLGRSDGAQGPSQGVLNMSGGSLNVRNGGSLILGNNLEADSSTGVFNQSGGTLHVDNDSSLWLSGLNASSGTYNFTGGTLQIGGNSLRAKYSSGSATNNFNLGGGTIQVTGTDLATNVAPTLMASSTSVINTNGLNATFSNAIAGNGGSLRKIGNGTLTVSNISAANGNLSIEAGTLSVKNGGSVGLATVIGAAGTLAIGNNPGSVGSITFSSGLTTQGGAVLQFTLGQSSNDTIYVGGDVSLGDGTIFQLSALAGLDLGVDHTWDLIVDQSGSNINLDNVTIQISGVVLGTVRSTQVGVIGSGNTVQLVYTAQIIPEPRTWLLLALGLGILLTGKRFCGIFKHRERQILPVQKTNLSPRRRR
jgi:autotransporter-associated beta strand protein